MLDDPLRGGGLLEENGCITTVPEWREVGHVRGCGLSLVHLLCMGGRERGREEDTCERTCEGHECMRQTHTIQVLYYMYAMPLIRLTL